MSVNGNGEMHGSMVPAGMTQRDEFGGAMTTGAETASSAVAAQATAAVQARFVMALRRPRNWDAVRVSILKDCKRPGFAEVARYEKPSGGKDEDGNKKTIVGPSIRFAEAAIRAMTNLLPETTTVYDDDSRRIVRVALTDLESNVSYSKDVTVNKTVERRYLKKGQRSLKARVNSSGDPVHVVEATDDDLLNKQNALESKALRGHALRLLPGDLLDECMAQVVATLRNEDAKDPDAARKKLVDAFASLNVEPAAIKEYLGHDIGTSSPAEFDSLRSIYVAIKEGEATWQSVMESRGGEKPKTAAPGEPAKTAADVVAKAKEKKAAKEKPAATAAAATTPPAQSAQASCPACHRFASEGHAPNCPETRSEGAT